MDELEKTNPISERTYTEAQVLKAAVRILQEINESHQPYSYTIITAEDAVYDLLSYLNISQRDGDG